MTPVETLKREHRLIERVLSALRRYAERAAHGEDVDLLDLASFVRFSREYVDDLHHGKEEDILFAALVEEGALPSGMGPVAVMLDEHEQGRLAVRALAELADQDALSSDHRERLARTVSAYAAMLEQHILKEDGILYPVAEARLPQLVMDEVARQCERFDAGRAEQGEALRALGEALILKYSARRERGDQLHP